MMYTAQLDPKGPFAIRYPKGRGVMNEWKTLMKELPIGKGRKICDGKDAAIITIGHVGNYAVTACEALAKENISVAHYDLRFLKPIDEALLHDVFKKFDKIVTVEDGAVQGGMGSAVLEFMADHGYSAKVVRLGIPDRFIEQGSVAELHRECGFDSEGIVQNIKNIIE
jgi:1-deoxy-D-xylulose-5-phosphate synthase